MRYLAILGPCLESGSTKHGKFQTYCEKGLGHMHVACGVSARPVVSQLVVDLKGASSGVITNMVDQTG